MEAWQEAVNVGAATRVRELSAEQIAVLGPRGGGLMPSDELAAWMGRSGFSAAPLRWFCGGDGTVVVEQAARWESRDPGVEHSAVVVASHFRVDGERVGYVGRHEDLTVALDTAGLTVSDEVIAHR